jgi:hypothetical protein
MPMPEASMNKQDSAVPRKDHIRSAGQIGAMKPEPQAKAMCN